LETKAPGKGLESASFLFLFFVSFFSFFYSSTTHLPIFPEVSSPSLITPAAIACRPFFHPLSITFLFPLILFLPPRFALSPFSFGLLTLRWFSLHIENAQSVLKPLFLLFFSSSLTFLGFCPFQLTVFSLFPLKNRRPQSPHASPPATLLAPALLFHSGFSALESSLPLGPFAPLFQVPSLWPSFLPQPSCPFHQRCPPFTLVSFHRNPPVFFFLAFSLQRQGRPSGPLFPPSFFSPFPRSHASSPRCVF